MEFAYRDGRIENTILVGGPDGIEQEGRTPNRVVTISVPEEFTLLVPALGLFLISFLRPACNTMGRVPLPDRQRYLTRLIIPPWAPEVVGRTFTVREGFFAWIPPGAVGEVIEAADDRVRVRFSVELAESFGPDEFCDTFGIGRERMG